MTATRAVPFTSVAFDDGFWAPRQAAVRNATIPFLHQQYEKAGIFAALDVRAPADPLPIAHEVTLDRHQAGHAGDVLGLRHRQVDRGCRVHAGRHNATQKLEAVIDDIVARIEAAQEPDGYFNSYFQRRAPEARFSNLRDWHELYCAGHLMEGAVAYAAATGKRRLLDVMCRYADLIARTFGRGDGQLRGYCGHEEVELALVKLARFTGETRYMDLARYFIDERGTPAALFRHRGAGARQRSGRLVSPHLRIQPVACPGARAGQGGGACGAGDVSVFGDGGPRGRGRRSGPARCLRPAVARPDAEAPLCHRRSRAVLDQRGLHARLRSAERDRLRRDLRRGRPGVLGASHAADDRRGRLCRCHGACAVQRRRQRHFAATAIGSSTRTRWPAAAAPSAGSGIAVHAVRRTSRGWWHRSVSMSPRSRRASCRCISTARAG